MKAKNYKLNPIRAAMMSTALIAFTNIATAAPVSTELDFICPFPLIGDQTIIAKITADYPQYIGVEYGGQSAMLPPIKVEAITVVPDKARQGLAFVDATTITGVAHSINTFHTTAGDISNNTDLTIEPTTIPEDEAGPFNVPAQGIAPAQGFDISHIGSVALTVDDLIMDLVNLKADGSIAPAPIGEFTADCTLAAGQDNVLTTFTVGHIEIWPPLPNIELTPSNFGEVPLGQSSEITATISNIGDGILGVNGIELSGGNAYAFTETNNCTTLEAGESCTATLTYTATELGTQNVTFALHTTSEDVPSTYLDLYGTAITNHQPVIDVDLTPLDFGVKNINELSSKTILVKNVGSADLTISDINITYSPYYADAMATFTETNDCTIVAPEENCSVTVTYRAPAEDTTTGTVSIISNDSNQSIVEINLTGTAAGSICLATESCGQKTPVRLDFIGSTAITANQSTLPIEGNIESLFDFNTSTFSGDLTLNPTQGSFEVIKGWSSYQATAHIEFEPVGKAESTLINGKLTTVSSAYIKMPKVTKTLFGLVKWPIGGGKDCRTKTPVNFTMKTANDDYFDIFSGGIVKGVYDLPELENCGVLTSIINQKFVGKNNAIELSVTPVAKPYMY